MRRLLVAISLVGVTCGLGCASKEAGENVSQGTPSKIVVAKSCASTVGDGLEGPSPSPQCAAPLGASPAFQCYQSAWAVVLDGQGVPHSGSLYDQVGAALGIAGATLPAQACYARAVDCGGDFATPNGTARVPSYPSPTSQEAHAGWLSAVNDFYANAQRPDDGQPLDPGLQALCVEWALESFKSKPDPSILQGLTRLAQYGAPLMVGIDEKYLTNIIAAGQDVGCDTPAALQGNVYQGAWMPLGTRTDFYNEFKTCDAENTSVDPMNCAHPFDAPHGAGNFVNANYLGDFTKCDEDGAVHAAAVVFDPSGGCGMSCYQ